jgi:hypothetical protein
VTFWDADAGSGHADDGDVVLRNEPNGGHDGFAIATVGGEPHNSPSLRHCRAGLDMVLVGDQRCSACVSIMLVETGDTQLPPMSVPTTVLVNLL